MCASVLPYAVDPYHGNTYFLLSRESCVPVWECSGLWSDFGGGAQEGEDVYMNAAREFHEESAMVVPFFPNEPMPRECGWKDISKALRDGKYTIMVKFETENWSYTTFIKQVPFIANLCDTFQKHYLDAVAGGKAYEAYTEKDAVQWVSPQKLLRAATSGKRRSSASGELQLRPHFKQRAIHILRHFPAKFAAVMTPTVSSALSWRAAANAAKHKSAAAPVYFKPLLYGRTPEIDRSWSDAYEDDAETDVCASSTTCGSNSARAQRHADDDGHGHCSGKSAGGVSDVPPGFSPRIEHA